MQQNSEKRWDTFKAALFASVAVHVVAAAFLIFDLPMTPPQPEAEEVVKVEMVPEPEKKPEPEKSPSRKKSQNLRRNQSQRKKTGTEA
ncbi:hypothetical protein LP421_28235 [Rhizobium sp. RCAM05350]|nr:hypothetical protein LP421_28235 [Rhizobium sp. RCAM05350]